MIVCVCVSLPAGTKHKTILEARSGLGPIKAYPRLGPKPSGEQGGGPVDPNTQERTFHCEICNVRVNSELQLKQVGERSHSPYIEQCYGSIGFDSCLYNYNNFTYNINGSLEISLKMTARASP